MFDAGVPDGIGGADDGAGADGADESGRTASSAARAPAGAPASALRALATRKRAKLSRSSRRPKSTGSSSRTRPVVKLLVTSVSRSYSEPWRRRQQRESSGTGFLIRWGGDVVGDFGGKGGGEDVETAPPTGGIDSIRIVTNAHVIRNASTVRARASFGPHVVSCEVEWQSLPLDLALLKIAAGDWDDFCKGWGIEDGAGTAEGSGDKAAADAATTKASNGSAKSADSVAKNGGEGCNKTLTLSSGLPKLDENVTCVGFPQGGTQISVTRGVVSRIDVDSHYVLRIQIDAAINPGNSGGPVFDEQGQVVGIASSHLRGAGNIGYIIPSKIVALFLRRSNEPRHVPGIPNLAIHGSQGLESKALRRHLGLEDLDLSGGIREDSADAGAGNRLRQDDVLLAINGIPIGMDGTIQLSPTRPDERINFRSIVTCQRTGSKVVLDVLRDRQRRELEVVLDMSRFLVSQYDDFDAIPLYVVVGGCVFSPLTLPLVQEKKSKSPSSFSRFYRDQRTGHEQVIVLSKVLNDDVNVGYHGWKNLVLTSVNGYEPTNIQELVAVLVRKMHTKMIEFRCQVVGQDDADYVICMNLKEVMQSEQRVLGQHMIASWCSKDALSKELREEVEEYEPSEAKRTVCWNSMSSMRAILERKEDT
ncbi:hypothetical protein ACHAWF_015558 [Thalassiosira exigua]